MDFKHFKQHATAIFEIFANVFNIWNAYWIEIYDEKRACYIFLKANIKSFLKAFITMPDPPPRIVS